MLCEMCGKDVERTCRTRIEGSVLLLCPDCSRFGVVLDPPPAAVIVASGALRRPPASLGPQRGATRRSDERDMFSDMGELELAPDWGRRIRAARESRQWTPDDLAKRLNEKRSLVLKLESGNFHPTDALVRKLEHHLGIRLRADPERSS